MGVRSCRSAPAGGRRAAALHLHGAGLTPALPPRLTGGSDGKSWLSKASAWLPHCSSPPRVRSNCSKICNSTSGPVVRAVHGSTSGAQRSRAGRRGHGPGLKSCCGTIPTSRGGDWNAQRFSLCKGHPCDPAAWLVRVAQDQGTTSRAPCPGGWSAREVQVQESSWEFFAAALEGESLSSNNIFSSFC